MRKKYIVSLIIVGLLIAFTLTIGTGYGLWVATNNHEEASSSTLNCFKVYFSNTDMYEMTNIVAVVSEDDQDNSPNTITVTNICDETKELQLRLNVLDTTTAPLEALTIVASGNIDLKASKYTSLKKKKTSEENTLESRLIGSVIVEPNDTVRTNIKLWFDEKKAPNLTPDLLFAARYELIDTESSIKATFAETLIANENNIETKGTPDFNSTSTSNDGLFIFNEGEVTKYYYRGAVDNNYVYFANKMWRIVGINEDGSVKLILNNTEISDLYSDYSNALDYTGLKYVYNADTLNNKINNLLENWYNENFTKYDDTIVSNNFCNDSNNSVINYHTYFAAYNRVVSNKAPTLVCYQTNQDFGGVYNQKVGLITADEVAMAGGLFDISNGNYYLANGTSFFTETPAEYYNYKSYVFAINESGALISTPTNSYMGIRPVINIDSNSTVTGNGTLSDPYIIDRN